MLELEKIVNKKEYACFEQFLTPQLDHIHEPLNYIHVQKLRGLPINNAVERILDMLKTDHLGFWYGLTLLTQLYSGYSPTTNKKLEDTFAQGIEYFKRMSKDSSTASYVDGFAYFIENNRLVNKNVIKNYTTNDFMFLCAVRYGSSYSAQVLSQYVHEKDFTKWAYSNSPMVIEKDLKSIVRMLEYLDNKDFYNSMILRICATSGISDVNFYEYIVEKYALDINATGIHYTHHEKTNFLFDAMQYLHTDVFEQLIKKFTFNLELDLEILHPISNTIVKKEFVEAVFQNFNQQHLILDKIEVILKNCNVNLKVFGQIVNGLFDKKYTATHYNHSVYELVLNHPLFKDNNFNNNTVLFSILEQDNSVEINQARTKTNDAVNPTTVLLEKYYASLPTSQIDSCEPFFYWATKQNSFFSTSTAQYLYDQYSAFIKKDNQVDNKVQPLNLAIKKFLILQGVHIVQEKGFWQKFLDMLSTLLNKNNTIVEEKIERQEYMPAQVIFDSELLQRIKNDAVLYYVDSIVLNAQQFVALNNDTIDQDYHYMVHLLPKFVNKTVENYLRFSAIEPEQATDNVLTQLKLLNKKTFDVLHARLEEHKDSATSENRVINKLIGKY